MPSQQVVSHPANAAMFLVYTVDGSDTAADTVRDVLGDLPGLTRSVGFRTPESELLSIVGIGSVITIVTVGNSLTSSPTGRARHTCTPSGRSAAARTPLSPLPVIC